MHHQLQISGFAFSPDPEPISDGDTLSWVNGDGAPHTATADDGSFNTDTIAPGEESDPITIASVPEDGIPYHCEVHPHMTATLSRA